MFMIVLPAWPKLGACFERNECFQRNCNLFADGGLSIYFKVCRCRDLQCHARIFTRGDRLTGWGRIRIVPPPAVVVAPEASVCPTAGTRCSRLVLKGDTHKQGQRSKGSSNPVVMPLQMGLSRFVCKKPWKDLRYEQPKCSTLQVANH